MLKVNKRNRISKYFIDSAKNQIIEKGIESVSVRRVAEDSGYSYATIYNYFADLNALLWAVKKEMIQDLILGLTNSLIGIELNQDGIKKIFHFYVKYFFDHPNIFRFFYFYSVKSTDLNVEETFDFSAMWENTFNSIRETNNLSSKDVQMISKTMINVIQGILTLHFSQNGEHDFENVCLEIDEILDYLVK